MSNTVHEAVPRLSAEEKGAMAELWQAIDAHRTAVNDEVMKAVEAIPEFASVIRAMRPEDLERQREHSNAIQRQALVDGDWDPYVENLRGQASLYAKMGIPFAAWLPLFTAFRIAMGKRFSDQARAEGARAARLADALGRFLDISVAVLGESYVAAKEAIIGQQQLAIRELSTPVLQVRDRLLILPVVGLVDTQRAKQLTASLLESIRDRRAEAVVMDITGVPVVDSKVAGHLAQACEAARLMGARVILTGISPEIAQALVTIGAELSAVRTVGDLQGGLEEAEASLGYRIVHASPAAAAGGA